MQLIVTQFLTFILFVIVIVSHRYIVLPILVNTSISLFFLPFFLNNTLINKKGLYIRECIFKYKTPFRGGYIYIHSHITPL